MLRRNFVQAAIAAAGGWLALKGGKAEAEAVGCHEVEECDQLTNYSVEINSYDYDYVESVNDALTTPIMGFVIGIDPCNGKSEVSSCGSIEVSDLTHTNDWMSNPMLGEDSNGGFGVIRPTCTVSGKDLKVGDLVSVNEEGVVVKYEHNT